MSYAVFVTVSVKNGRLDEAEEGLRTMVVPSTSQSGGFLHGTWWRSADDSMGYGLVVFENEAAAKEMAAQVVEPPGDAPVSIKSVEVGAVSIEA